MRRALWLAAILLLLAALLVGGCGNPKAIKPLTDEEKDRFIEIAQNTPEALRYMENESNYETEVDWIGLGRRGSVSVETHRFDYEEIADGNLPVDRLYFSESLTLHPHVYIRVGEPVRMFISVAIDRETEEVLNVELLPGRGTPGPARGPTPAE